MTDFYRKRTTIYSVHAIVLCFLSSAFSFVYHTLADKIANQKRMDKGDIRNTKTRRDDTKEKNEPTAKTELDRIIKKTIQLMSE